MAGHGGGNPMKAVLAAMLGNGLISLAKFGAWFFTGSSSMLAEAFHSVADTGNQVLLVIGLKREQKPADKTHPYGYGKEGYFWSFVVALILFSLGAGFAFYEGFHKLHEIQSGTAGPIKSQLAGIIVLGVSLVIEFMSFYVAFAEFKRTLNGLTIRQAIRETRASALVVILFEDAAAVVGLAIAFISVGLTAATGNPIFDVIGTFIIAVVLAGVAIFLSVFTKNLLIGLSASPRVDAQIEAIVRRSPAVVEVAELKTLHMGGEFILVNLGVLFDPAVPAADLPTAIDEIEVAIRAEVPAVKRIFIEAESFKQTALRMSGKGP